MSTSVLTTQVYASRPQKTVSPFTKPAKSASTVSVKLSNVCKAYDGKTVLDGVNYEANVSSLAIIGPSGEGKSTLLRILGGLLMPTSGDVQIGGLSLEWNESALLSYRRQLGFVFQGGGLFHHLSARENIALPLREVHHVGTEEANERANELLKRLGLGSDGDKKPAELSGGQQQRVAIARALAPAPKLLLLDEPTSALDPELTVEFLDILRDVKETGARFIIVTHEMGFARHACDDVAFLSGGRLRETGPSEIVFSDPTTPELQHFLTRLLEWRV